MVYVDGKKVKLELQNNIQMRQTGLEPATLAL